jgi:predicted nuclease of predicted toxin-antitoxin system
MKILLDEGLPRRAAALLRAIGVDAVHLTEVADPSTADDIILETARASERVVVTLDTIFMRCSRWEAGRRHRSFEFDARDCRRKESEI